MTETEITVATMSQCDNKQRQMHIKRSLKVDEGIFQFLLNSCKALFCVLYVVCEWETETCKLLTTLQWKLSETYVKGCCGLIHPTT